MESALKELKEMQDRAEKKYMEWEDERWKREVEIEEGVEEKTGSMRGCYFK